MKPASPPRLGELERAVMEHLWAGSEGQEPAGQTVRQVYESLGRARGLAYTTVMTVLSRLAKKGLATRTRDGRAWVYYPAGSREQLTAETLHHALGGLHGENRREALLHFLDGSTPAELAELRAALDEFESREP